jgi:membrane protein implicated in regulation of membrane protease activity
MTWWMWALIGLGLLAGEALTPGTFYFLFFGAGAFLTSALVWVGAFESAWAEWLAFTVASLACLVPFRGRLVRWASSNDGRAVDSLVGEEVALLDDVPAGAVGKGELRGSTWNVRSDAGRALQRGERARVVRVDGLTLWV